MGNSPNNVADATALNKPTSWSWDWRSFRLKLQWPDTLDLLSEFDTKRYRGQRRLIGPTYSATNLRKFEPAVESVVRRAVEELKKVGDREVDLKQWMHILAVECLGEVVLSWSPGYIKARSDGGTSGQSYMGWNRKSVFGLFPTVTAVGFWLKGASRLWADLWGVTFTTPKGFKPFFTVSISLHPVLDFGQSVSDSVHPGADSNAAGVPEIIKTDHNRT